MKTRTDPALLAWTIDEAAFPVAGSATQQLAFLVAYAVLAPSSHNTQPWHFVVEGDGLDLFADRSRRLPVVDPHDRALTISCGAAAECLRVAAAHFGLLLDDEWAPDPRDPDLLVRVRHAGVALASPQDDERFAAIPRRRTNRSPYLPDPAPSGLPRRLVDAAVAHRAHLTTVTDPVTRSEIADLVAEGDRAQMGDPEFRRELADWIRPNHSTSGDGMRGYAFGIGDLTSRAGAFVVRTFDAGKRQAARDHEAATTSPLLAVLSTRDDDPRSWTDAGRALASVLLTAAAAGHSAAFLNQPIEVPELRPRLAEAAGTDGHPQLLFRVGIPTEDVPPEPRRPVEDVLQVFSRD